jgi:hypothetical protein
MEAIPPELIVLPVRNNDHHHLYPIPEEDQSWGQVDSGSLQLYDHSVNKQDKNNGDDLNENSVSNNHETLNNISHISPIPTEITLDDDSDADVDLCDPEPEPKLNTQPMMGDQLLEIFSSLIDPTVSIAAENSCAHSK